MNRNMCIFDATGKLDDNAIIKGTNIILRNKATGKVIFKGSNKVIASGSEFAPVGEPSLLKLLLDIFVPIVSPNKRFPLNLKSLFEYLYSI